MMAAPLYQAMEYHEAGLACMPLPLGKKELKIAMGIAALIQIYLALLLNDISPDPSQADRADALCLSDYCSICLHRPLFVLFIAFSHSAIVPRFNE